jgi:Carboxypeptidase regulatory-like domain
MGRVTKGPLSPVERFGGPPPFVGVVGARIEIATEHGDQVTSVLTDASGDFKVRLAPGTYNLTMPSMHGAMFTRDLPATVTITAGVAKQINIYLDTGIR